MPNNTPLSIGQVAKLAGVHVETIRYYQRQGLLQTPPKPISGYRIYPTDSVDRLRFIQRAKALGFTLTEIGNLLSLEDNDCEQVQTLAQGKLKIIQQKIVDLQTMQKALETLLNDCQTHAENRRCPLISALSSKHQAS